MSSMRRKKPVPFTQKFPNVDPLALHLLERMLAFDPKDRPSAEEVVSVTCLLVLEAVVIMECFQLFVLVTSNTVS